MSLSLATLADTAAQTIVAAAQGLLSRLDFAALLAQNGRMLQVHTALPQLALIPERMVYKDALSQPFELSLDCLSTNAYFELKSVLGEQISVCLLQADGSYKPWHGYVTQAAQLGSDGGLARYRLVMRPWLSLLSYRRDSFVFQDKTALQIVEDVFADYTQANYRVEVSDTLRLRSLCIQYRETDLEFVTRLLAEEGLSSHYEHLDEAAAASADSAAQARHVLVISDRLATRPDLGPVRFATQSPVANLAGQRDAITAFMAERQVAPNAVTLGAWNYRQISSSTAQDQSQLEIGELPALEIYDGSGAYRYQDEAHAQRSAAIALAALELRYKHFEGQGSARHFAAGSQFSLIDHPLYGANTSALSYAGALTASHERPDNAFTLLAVEHHATNNLGAQAAQILDATELEHGTYKNHFYCVPAAATPVPRLHRKPTALGAQTALVVGLEGEPLTTDRDHRVKIQFAWQRGNAPLAGGLNHSGSPDTQGNAPGNEASGTWVRVALPSAGANWGSVFTPRIGSEVIVGFIENDIDRPIITGQLYNGQDTPPFAAGVDSGVNHPGVISGLHSQALDGGNFNQWVMDDATGQLRMRMLTSYTGSELGLGYLIAQDASSANRGSWRGSGFELSTQGWASLRAAQGLLLTTSARAGTYGSAQSTQMDAAEAIAQLKSVQQLGQALGHAAQAGGAHDLSSFEGGPSVEHSVDQLLQAIDPSRDGKHPASVNGQEAKKAQEGGRELGDPVEAFAQPVMVLDTPSSALYTSAASLVSFSGQNLSVGAQGDAHQASAHTYSAISGQTTSHYAHSGGIKAYAANGPVSLRAHTDQLQMLADQDVTIISVNNEITIAAHSKIVITGADSGIVLDGGNIDFMTPGQFSAKTSTHAFLGGGSEAASLPGLPTGLAQAIVSQTPLSVSYTQAIDHSSLAADWLPQTLGAQIHARVEHQTLASFGRGDTEMMAGPTQTSTAQSVNYWHGSGGTWQISEALEQPQDIDHGDGEAQEVAN